MKSEQQIIKEQLELHGIKPAEPLVAPVEPLDLTTSNVVELNKFRNNIWFGKEKQ